MIKVSPMRGFGGGLEVKRKLLELQGALSGTLAAKVCYRTATSERPVDRQVFTQSPSSSTARRK